MSGRQRAPTGRSNAARDVSTGALTAREPSPRAGTAGNGAGAGTSAFSGRGMRPSFATAALASLTRPATVIKPVVVLARCCKSRFSNNYHLHSQSAAKIDSGSDISPREPQYSARFSGRDTEVLIINCIQTIASTRAHILIFISSDLWSPQTNRGSGDILLFDQSSQAKARPQETNPV
jgi:hypothetical protein